MISLLQTAVEMGGADVFVLPGASVMVKVNNDMRPLTGEKLSPARAEELIRQSTRSRTGTFRCWTRRATTTFPSRYPM